MGRLELSPHSDRYIEKITQLEHDRWAGIFEQPLTIPRPPVGLNEHVWEHFEEAGMKVLYIPSLIPEHVRVSREDFDPKEALHQIVAQVPALVKSPNEIKALREVVTGYKSGAIEQLPHSGEWVAVNAFGGLNYAQVCRASGLDERSRPVSQRVRETFDTYYDMPLTRYLHPDYEHADRTIPNTVAAKQLRRGVEQLHRRSGLSGASFVGVADIMQWMLMRRAGVIQPGRGTFERTDTMERDLISDEFGAQRYEQTFKYLIAGTSQLDETFMWDREYGRFNRYRESLIPNAVPKMAIRPLVRFYNGVE